MTDGITEPATTRYCIYTSSQNYPWVKIDLQKQVWIDHFKVYPMFNNWVKNNPNVQLRDVVFGVGSDVDNESSICGKYNSPIKKKRTVIKVFCNRDTDGGAYFKSLVKPGVITLCELQVFGKGMY